MGSDFSDHFDLGRFIEAQNGVYPTVTSELRAGHKRSHWIWFIFPQVDGLGHSHMAQRYSIRSRGETIAYLNHHLLATRLVECASLVLKHTGKTAHEILGSPDDLKFRSSMSLFAEFSAEDSIFRKALDNFYGGEPDPATLAVLDGWMSRSK